MKNGKLNLLEIEKLLEEINKLLKECENNGK